MSVQYNSSIVTNGLVLCLDAANRKSYPGSGTTWTDLSGRGNNGSLINGVGYNSANGGSLSFDGTNQYATTPSSSLYAFGQNGTVDQWVYILGNSGNNNRFWCINNNPSALDAYLNGSTYNVGFHGGNVVTATTIPQNTWVNLTVSYISGTINVYFNGNLQSLTGTTTGYNITSQGTLFISQFSGGGSYYLNGRISSMKIYNKGLTQVEIQQNFNALRGRYSI